MTVRPAGPVGKRHVFLTLAFEDDNNARQLELVLSERGANRLGQALICGSVGVGREFSMINGPD